MIPVKHLAINLEWEGEGVNEEGIIASIAKEASTSQHLNNSTLSPGETIIEVDRSIFGLRKLNFYQVISQKPKKNWAGRRSIL